MSGIELDESGWPKTFAIPCIYRIVNLKTGDFYIGSAWKGSERMRSHWTALKNNRHGNGHLQRAWNKYGMEMFQFDYLRTFRANEMTRDALYTLEQSYLDLWKPTYNISRSVTHPTMTEEQRIAVGKRTAKAYIVTDPNGNEQKIIGLKPFCKDKGLDASAMSRVLAGKWSNHRGWKVRYVDGSPPIFHDGRQRRDWIITDVCGKEYRVKNLRGFCREHQLIAKCMADVAKGTSSNHRGWMCRYATDDKQRYVPRGHPWQGDKDCPRNNLNED